MLFQQTHKRKEEDIEFFPYYVNRVNSLNDSYSLIFLIFFHLLSIFEILLRI